MNSLNHDRPAVFDVAIAGAGPAGLAAGLAAARLGLAVAVIGPIANPNDGRTAALFLSSVEFLKNLQVWSLLGDGVEPLAAIRLVDATGALFRAPEVTFRADEIGIDAFGYNVPNARLTHTLEMASEGLITRNFASVEAVNHHDLPELVLSNGETIRAHVVGAADGRNSIARDSAGIEIQNWNYDQAAVVTTFSHTRPHQNISTEFHRNTGPLTVVPGPGSTSSLVLVETPDEAARLSALDESAFAAALQKHIGGLLGALFDFAPRRVFPLAGQTAKTLAQNRTALIGEAGHVIPPIGAQGLNLSFRDAATLAEIAREAKDQFGDAGCESALSRFRSERAKDVTSRVWTVDLLNRSLLSELIPVHFARGFGLFALNAIGPLRRFVMREGVAPAFSTPQLMQTNSTIVRNSTPALDGASQPRA